MRHFSNKELDRLDLINPALQKVIRRAQDKTDFFIVCGHRDQLEQDLAFTTGHSKVIFPNSKHNKSVIPNYKSDAVDLCPYPIDWNNISGFKSIYYAMIASAVELNIPIRCGADWNGDGNLTNDKFVDMPHYEIVF
jgi:peptidoglycan L-alanyl-D-glutamate endopeptidase CwlK